LNSETIRFVFALFLGCAALVCSALATKILTDRGDNARTGLNANERVLTPSIVSSPSFGLFYNNSVDGQVYAQPLYVSNQLIIVNGRSRGTRLFGPMSETTARPFCMPTTRLISKPSSSIRVISAVALNLLSRRFATEKCSLAPPTRSLPSANYHDNLIIKSSEVYFLTC
jgi:hypothetical protein